MVQRWSNGFSNSAKILSQNRDRRTEGVAPPCDLPLCICRFLGVPLLLYDGLNVKLVIIDKHPLMTCRTFGVSTPVTLTLEDSVLGLASETRFLLLAQFGFKMMAFVMDPIKHAMTMRAIISGSSATNVVRTVKTSASTAAVSLAGMVGAVLGVETPFTIQTIIWTVHEGRKRGAIVKMMIGFQ